MSYNAVLDIPTLLMILLMGAFFAFRKSYYYIYQLFLLFLAYWVHTTFFLKILYAILTEIRFVQDAFIANQDNKFVQIC